MPTAAGNVAEDMITDTDVYHTLKFVHQEDVRRDACNVGDETGLVPSVQLNNERGTSSRNLLNMMIRVSCHFANQESSHELGVSFVHPIPKSVQSNSVPKLVVSRNV